ncbi:hypothetical protein OK016_26255 [Vibrio chagasii]|nr:hypothetical protein [Vibrio chagasii]
MKSATHALTCVGAKNSFQFLRTPLPGLPAQITIVMSDRGILLLTATAMVC